jgi:hypothetical protein
MLVLEKKYDSGQMIYNHSLYRALFTRIVTPVGGMSRTNY